MIRWFACVETDALFYSRSVARFRNIERAARRKLLQMHAASELASLRVPPLQPTKVLASAVMLMSTWAA